MTSRAQSQHDQGNCWPDNCQFCRWEMEEESTIGLDDDPPRYAAPEGREVPASIAVGGNDVPGTAPQALV